ncbi:hypothetical protein C8A05DRAFT_13694 [Staphylotrichum tortipilum]|uniref:ubiquitinyl hydrolase 1 n=1 Tax=Staphylotrichum tortipilum TaxID=2831512 RepID=A0AAN6MNZ5_9PEZI|nr:hypothetical protein C8A05DRAFT_13694 [Staphylotrichum longicolle]
MAASTTDPTAGSAAMRSLEYAIYHVFLPPKCPQADDTNIKHEHNLIHSLLQSAKRFSAQCSAADAQRMGPVIRMLDRLLEAKPGMAGTDKKTALQKTIRDLKNGECALFHIRAQNAGLLLSGRPDDVLVEAFELLAPNNKVMSCQGRLIRQFPDCAAAVGWNMLRDPSFADEFVSVLLRLEIEASPLTRSKSRKSGKEFDEERDTDSPVLATDMLMGTLAGFSRTVEPQRVAKRSREQVNWDTARLPFHRSPTWMLLRVALRLALDHTRAENDMEACASRALYKALITFHHTQILDQARPLSFSSELRFVMEAKIVGRLKKMDAQQDLGDAPWLREIKTTIAASHDGLQLRWQQAQRGKQDTVLSESLAGLDFHQDSNLRIPELSQHLSWIQTRAPISSGAAGPGDKSKSVVFSSTELPSLALGSDIFSLLELESWIDQHLSSWVASRLAQHGTATANQRPVEGDLEKLQDLRAEYYAKASAAYEGQPEALSAMCLNIMDLWVAMDKIAGNAIPLLLEFDPGFTLDFLNPLLLPTRRQMTHLDEIELYLSSRKRATRNGYPHIFSNFGKPESFAVRYFDSSPQHQNLLERVRAWAEDEEAKKIELYRRLRRKYDDLTRRISASEHNQGLAGKPARLVCLGCTLCQLEREKSDLNITLFEWPLPEDRTLSKGIIFEISVPRVVAVWRDMTSDLFLSVFQGSDNLLAANRLWHAHHHSGLSSFMSGLSKIRLASPIKPVEASHYRAKHISTISESKVCVRHPWFSYDYYNHESGVRGTDLWCNPRVPLKCSFAEHQITSPLGRWTRSTVHTSNQILAAQSSCPQTMSLDEFRAFGHLRSGLTLQWANVLCQLLAPSLDWNKESTYLLILQACFEAGPADPNGSVFRETHTDLLNEDFIHNMVIALVEALGRFRANWQNETAISLLVCLATRVLSLTMYDWLMHLLLDFLSEAREVTIKWARQLLERQSSCTGGKLEEWKDLDERILTVALACLATFDMEPDLLGKVLRGRDLAVLVEAAILAHDHMPSAYSQAPASSMFATLKTGSQISSPMLRMLLHRWHGTMRKSQVFVRDEVLIRRNTSFCHAIKLFWAEYCAFPTRWGAVDRRPGIEGSHILRGTRQPSHQNRDEFSITFNVLEGRLLVNGYPLARLPGGYQTHRTYKCVFGNQVLEVIPSARQGMRFSACRLQQGWVVHFALDGPELVIRALRGVHEYCEFIPPWKLQGDVPSSFIQDYSHWLNLDTGVVEFRPVNEPWASCPESNWALVRNGTRTTLERKGCFSIDVHSPTAVALSALLAPIESNNNVGMVFNPQDGVLQLDLPRFSLSFTLAKGHSRLWSKHYSGMHIDECQSIGALIGLENKLVLKQDGVSELCTPQRMVLVPRGRRSSTVTVDTMRVTIEQPLGTTRVKHDAFNVDSRLGQLISRGSLFSRLHLCHLHALTSHFLPDPLTGRTGTEEALRILQSAAVRSFERLDAESYRVLCEIATISPKRQFYPQHLEAMEQVRWSKDLPVLSQHDGFWPAVEEILSHARDCELLHRGQETSDMPPELKSIPRPHALSLAQRAKIRHSGFQVSEFGGENHTTALDRHYSGRHFALGRAPENFMRSKMVATRLLSGSQDLLASPSATLEAEILKIAGVVFSRNPPVDITFKLEYLEPHSTSLASMWCGLHLALAREQNKYKVGFFLSALVHATDASWDVIQALLAIAIVRDDTFKSIISPPMETHFNLDRTLSLMHNRVNEMVREHIRPLQHCPEAQLPRLNNESKKAGKARRNQLWKSKSIQVASLFTSALASQWRRQWTVSVPTDVEDAEVYLHVETIMHDVSNELVIARRTYRFKQYVRAFVDKLTQMRCDPGDNEDAPMAESPPLLSRPDFQHTQQSPQPRAIVSCNALFSQTTPPPTVRPKPVSFRHLYDLVTQSIGEQAHLPNLFDTLARLCADNPPRLAYLADLRTSSTINTSRPSLKDAPIHALMLLHLHDCVETTTSLHIRITNALTASASPIDPLAHQITLYPRLTPLFLLQRLTRPHFRTLPRPWCVCLINYALSLTYLQRAERLVWASSCDDHKADLLRELLNVGSHCDELWGQEAPESLVLEVEQGILIREAQRGIAANMTNPPAGQNAVMQLNMGEGKSSVIVPVVAAGLANGGREGKLVRVIVAKPQAKQMMHTLVATLGGLVGRRVFVLPVSRAMNLGAVDVVVVRKMLDECRVTGGVLLVQPEHLLSFKLMGLERCCDADGDRVGKMLLETYREFEDVARDIVDESDENFSVKFELIYTMGAQQPIDMSPERWSMIQELMDVVLDVARDLATKTGPEVTNGLLFEEDTGSGRFPTIRVLEEEAGKKLIKAVAIHICQTGLKGCPVQHQPSQTRQAVLEYILLTELDPAQIKRVEDSVLFGEPAIKNALLLLRGLLAINVILFALGQKRYRVNYGLAPYRQPPTMLAVPYRAKDAPAPRSEFSHPEVVIVLTCLSYYYQGLSDDELRVCLEQLSISDQAVEEYGRWAAASPKLPPSLRHFSGVNLKDTALFNNSIFPGLRYVKPTIDFYLATIVYPKEMREFPRKLSASGWDLGKAKRHPLTGFSGTTDSKYVLPLSVKALDLPEQRHTNSAVLACLLRDENMVLELGGNQNQLSTLSLDMLLTAVTTSVQPMRVILDVGAQIIELGNIQVAQRWLELVTPKDADAVIFFNDQDELSVLTRDGMVESFFASPFATQTGRCLVFLDQAHTRGTDLRLPDAYRAAVTLGPGITKDTLVQACMRMRKLGSGQSVTFCVSLEMQKRIRNLAKVDTLRPLTVVDILTCAISETWEDAHRSVPLWAAQGLRHQHQEVIWEGLAGKDNISAEHVRGYLEEEAQSLELRYRPLSQTSEVGSRLHTITSKLHAAAALDSRQEQVALIRAKCVDFGLANLDTMGNLQEEQERELAPEIERERHVERPPARKPYQHSLHPDVRHFAHSGILMPDSPAFIPAFHTLAQTTASAHFPAKAFPSTLLATVDFAHTVKARPEELPNTDAYQRPVQWVLTTPGSPMVLVSPWEANALKPLMLSLPQRAFSPTVHLRAYLPRTSLSHRTLEHLRTYYVPPVPTAPAVPDEQITELNLFAGQLHLRSHEEYTRVCRYLGLSRRENQNNQPSDNSSNGRAGDVVVGADGFVGKNGGKGYEECKFTMSPLGFLAVLYKRVRRECLEIGGTDMGRVLAGGVLREKDFEGRTGNDEEERQKKLEAEEERKA